MITISKRTTGEVVFASENPHDAAIFMCGKNFLNYRIYVAAEPLPFKSAEIFEFEDQIRAERAHLAIERSRRVNPYPKGRWS